MKFFKLVTRVINYSRCKIYKYKFKSCGKNLRVFGSSEIWGNNITVGDNVSIYPGVNIWGNGKIVIGNNVAIGKDTIVFSNKSIIIEDNTLIAGQAYIIDSDHNFATANQLIREQGVTSESITIKSDVWIGAGTKILKGVTIEKGAVIGANSLVNKDIEEYSINVGSPTKAVGSRK